MLLLLLLLLLMFCFFFFQSCVVTILDDSDEPVLEGAESFTVSIAAADSRSLIGQSSTTLVTIDDTDLDG